MAGEHHRFNGHELGKTLGDGEGQGGLACCSPWDHKELDTTGQLNNNHRNEYELGQIPGDGEGQGGLACCSIRGHKELATTGWLNNNSYQTLRF